MLSKPRVQFVLSVAYFFATRCIKLLKRLAGRRAPGSLAMLCYHEVTAQQAQSFARHMDLVERLGETVYADTSLSLPRGHHIAVTFDDGFANLLDNALPLLRDRHIPCTLFLTTGDLGRTPGWLVGSDHPTADLQLMTERQVRDLSLADIRVGSHSVTHPDMRTLTGAPLFQELSASKETLEGLTGEPVTLVAYPYGYFNSEVLTASVAAGYERAFTAEDVLETDEYLVPRIEVSPDDGLFTLRLKALGAYAWLPMALHLVDSIKGRSSS